MERKTIRWLILGGLFAIFVFFAFWRKEMPQSLFENQNENNSKSNSTPTPDSNPTVPFIDEGEVQPSPPDALPETTHIVQPGETLFSISQLYNVEMQDVAQLNQILEPSQIMVGQEIKISSILPKNGEETPPSASPTQDTPPTSSPTNQPLINSATILNNIPHTTILNLPPETRQHIDEIYTRGQEIGRNPNAFSKLGDSTIMAPGLLVQFDQGAYNLGDFAYLQSVIDHYTGSFERYGAATHVGLHAWTVFDPMITDNNWCLGNEDILACELRLHNPSILFIRLGSNDAGIPESFDQHTREVVEAAIDNGVIPIIGTKADRFEGEENINNQILRQIATDYHVPLWDFDVLASTLPNRGLDAEDNVHIDKATVTIDYTQPTAFQSGQAMQDLSALLMLEAIWQEVNN